MKLFNLFYLLIPIICVKGYTNNACKTFKSYLNILSSPNCYHIPDNNKDVPEIIKRHTGVGETHYVTTEDGYILSLFRIPQKNSKKVILLQHGIFQDSKMWVAQSNESVAFLFWQAGYDVWLTNGRGTSYGQNHTRFSIEDKKFWNHSFHEMGYYDISASAEYIKKVSKVPKIIFVGQCMGFTSGLVYASMKPEDAAKSFKIIVALAPAAFFKYVTTPLVQLFFQPIHYVMKFNMDRLLRWYSVLHHNGLFLKMFRALNRISPIKKILVYGICFLIGWSPDQVDPNYFNLMIDQFGSALSLKTVNHYYQIYQADGNFQMYDYGKEKNMQYYGTEKPPLYPLEKIKTPIYMIYSTGDKIVEDKDSEYLFQVLPEHVKKYGKKKIEGFNHLDYYFGKHRNEIIYKDLLGFLEKF